MFDAPSTSALPSGREMSRDDDASDEGEEDENEDGETGLPLNGRASKKQDSRSSRAAAVVAMLQQVSEEQVQEISQVCRCVSASALLLKHPYERLPACRYDAHRRSPSFMHFEAAQSDSYRQQCYLDVAMAETGSILHVSLLLSLR